MKVFVRPFLFLATVGESVQERVGCQTHLVGPGQNLYG